MVNFWLEKRRISLAGECFSLGDVAGMLAVSQDFILRMMEMGIIVYEGNLGEAQIPSGEIERFEEVRRIHDDLGVNWAGASLIVDLLKENQRLKQELSIAKKQI